MRDTHIQLRQNPIAIVGMGAIMPQAKNLREFWNNVVEKVDCISDVPRSRWDSEAYHDPDPTAPDKTYCKRGGFMPDVDFDPLEWGLPPNILEVTDVSQMLSLLVAKEALTDAGYMQATDKIRERTGVILGVGGGQKLITPLTSRLQYPVWDEVLKSYGIGDEDRVKIIERMKMAYIGWEENSFPGMLGNVISGRIANRFDLGGTNCVVDAACASTMAAMKMAVAELTDGRADMMITGGADTDNSIFMYMCFSKTPAFSKGTHPRPFDIESDGMMVGEGIGMMVLKRLDDAERDGDRIYAVIKGLGSSSDGRYKSIYAPRGEGQERALRRAYEDAGFSPSTVGLVEAHGTGTVAGDTTEVSTIIRYFKQHDNEKQHIALGSVKSQIGHTKASAGAAGLIKTALALHHKVLPPTLNVNQPHPKFDIPNSAFYINTEARPWIQGDEPRRAGVSSFGFGGTNFHVVLEEYNADHKGAYRVHSTPQAIILNASTPSDLQTQIANAITQLLSDDADRQFLNLVRATRALTLPAHAARVGFIATTPAEAIAMLEVAQGLLASKPDAEEWQHPKGVFYRRQSMNVTGRVVALFSGQGSQYLDMGRELALNFPEIREAYAQLDVLMRQDGKPSLSSVVYPHPTFSDEEREEQESVLQSTEFAQPAIGATSMGLYRLLRSAGFRADFAAGHSFGEVSALWAAGVISDEDYYKLIKARGAAMAPPANNPNFDVGTMMAVVGDVEAIEREVANLPGVQIANRNSRTQVVVAGSKDAVLGAENILKAKGFKTTPLVVSAAFHTPLVGHAQKPFAQAINSAEFHTPQIPVYSNATGRAYPKNPAVMKQMLAEHILQPVLFRDEIEQIYAAGGTIFVEFGPRNVLTNLVKDILADRPHVAIALNGSRQKDSDQQLREAIVQLQVLGLPFSALDPYTQDVETPEKKKGLNVKLNGANYVSEKTRNAYQDALASGGTVTIHASAPSVPQSLPVPQQVVTPPVVAAPPVPIAPPVAAVVAVPIPAASPIQPASQSVPSSDKHSAEIDMNTIIQTLEHSLAEFREHQRATLDVHEQYSQNQSEYFRIFFELTTQQQALIASQTLPPAVVETLTQNMQRFHDYQAETLRLHEHYMRNQTEIAQSLLDIVRQQYAGMSSGVVVTTNGNGNGSNGNGSSPKPASYAPPTAVAPAARPAPVSVPATNGVHAPAPAPVAPPVPVQQVAAPAPVVRAPAPVPLSIPVAPVQQVAPAPVAPVAPPAAAPASNGGISVAALSEAMLRIVSDKTGYPSDMLELSMDMEADLGIDSIKRVEIMGAMRDEFTNLPQFSPEELAELRTLQQIVDYMRERSGGSAEAAPAPVAPPVTNGAHAPVAPPVPVQQVAAPAPVAPPAPASNGGIELAALSEAMLRIVSDKTGYPSDMLELSMDMEADLGIDSIKRVEIMGAMRDEFTNLPQFSPEELAELRTLQQIVDYMKEVSRQASPFDLGGTSATEAFDEHVALAEIAHNQINEVLPAIDTKGIERSVVELRRLPAPDFQEFAVNGAVCIIADDGTAVTPLLSHALTEHGWRVITLSLPQTIIPANPHLNGDVRVQLPDMNEASLKITLASIAEQYGGIGGFIYLNAPADNVLFAEQDKAMVKFAFLMAKHLKPYLTRTNGTGRKCFMAITRLDGALGTSADATYGAISGGLFGLIKTLNLEWQNVFCRAVDIAPGTSPDVVAGAVLAELYDPNRLLTEVAYGLQGRATLMARQAPTNGVK